MRGLKFLVLGVAIAAGVGAVALVKRELDRARDAGDTVALVAPAPPPIEARKAEVLVVSRALRLGETLRPEDLRWQPWPYEAVAESYVTRQSAPEAIESYQGAVVRATFVAGEPVSSAKVLKLNHSGVLSTMIRDGLRAISIRIAPETGAGGFVLPGDFVDVILTRGETVDVGKRNGKEKEKPVKITNTLIRSVRVMAVDTVLDAEDNAALSMNRSVTLEVTPEQAELLSLGEQVGRITLSLRGVAELVNDEGEVRKEIWPETAIDRRMLDPRYMQAWLDGGDLEQPVEETAATAREPEPAAEIDPVGEQITIVRGGSIQRATVK